MSLLDNAFEKFTVINKVVVNDGLGGTQIAWVDGITIDGAIVYDSSAEMLMAQAAGVTSAYTLTVRKSTLLDYHTVLRREKDKQIFRLTSNSDDKQTPESAMLNMRQYSAEVWKLT